MHSSVHLTRGSDPRDYEIRAAGVSARVRVIEVVGDQIINHERHATLPVTDGQVQADVASDVLKLAVVERYGKNGNVAIAFVSGFHLRAGAISSTIAHDHHNLVIVGADETSMSTCAQATQQMQGGLVVARGQEVLARLPLPLGGLLHSGSALEVIAELDKLNAAARTLGCQLHSPFMTLSFISLPSIPDLGMTDQGLVDVLSNCLVSAILDGEDE